MKELTIILSVALIIFISIISGTVYIGLYAGEASCKNYGKATNQEVYYGYATGCMVQRDGTWKPATYTVEILGVDRVRK